MSVQIVFHIGYPKTGTTAIQKAFFSEKRALLDLGILYPDSGLRPNDTGHHDLFSNIQTVEDFSDSDKRRFIDDLHAELKMFSGKVVVSTEDMTRLFLNTPETIRKFASEFSKYDTKFVVFIRRADQYFQSFFYQKLKAFGTGHLVARLPNVQEERKFVRKKADQHLQMLFDLSKVYNKDKLCLRRYEPEKDSPTVFCEAASLTDCLQLPGFSTRQSVNTRFHHDYLYLIYQVATHKKWKTLQPILVKHRSLLFSYTQPDSYSLTIYKNQDIEIIKSKLNPSYTKLAEMYGINLYQADEWDVGENNRHFLSTPNYSAEFLDFINKELVPAGLEENKFSPS